MDYFVLQYNIFIRKHQELPATINAWPTVLENATHASTFQINLKIFWQSEISGAYALSAWHHSVITKWNEFSYDKELFNCCLGLSKNPVLGEANITQVVFK